MPLFSLELNRLADTIVASTVTVRLHTSAPSDSAPTNGRTTAGGTGYENGIAVAAADWSAASNGDVDNDNDVEFGTADEAVGTVTHWSAYRGSVRVGWGTLPSTAIGDGDTFKINAGTLQLNGSSS